MTRPKFLYTRKCQLADSLNVADEISCYEIVPEVHRLKETLGNCTARPVELTHVQQSPSPPQSSFSP